MNASPPDSFGHLPVLCDRVVELLAPALQAPGATCVDATVGLGGHTEALLAACPQARVIGLDRDPEALRLSRNRLAGYGTRFQGVHAVFDDIGRVLQEGGLACVQAVLFDFGVSSMHLDDPQRGFAYRLDAPLDMRMDPTQELTAAEVLNTYPVDQLSRILRDYGEERHARRIARHIVAERDREPFTTSARLVELLHRLSSPSARGGHPAKRTFQALRIEVNQELAVIKAALPAAIEALGVGGRVAVLSYHSLEDRMVKTTFAAGSTSTTPPGLPVELAEHAPYLRLLTRGAEVASAGEIAVNPRAASVRLRAAEKTRVRKGGSR